MRIARALQAALLVLCAVSARADTMEEDLIAAAGSGDLARISALLKKGANVNARDAQGRTPVMAATYGRHASAMSRSWTGCSRTPRSK